MKAHVRELSAIVFLALAVLTVSNIAVADDRREGRGDSHGDKDLPQLLVRDNLLASTDRQPRVTVTISGESFYFYSIAVGANPVVLAQQGESFVPAASAAISTSGKLDRNGSATIEISLPRNSSGKVYLQAFTSRRLTGGDRNLELSAVSTVTLLQEVVSQLDIVASQGAAGPKGDTGAPGPQGLKGDKGVLEQ